MQYALTPQEFNKNKKLLDGYVFWRMKGDMVIVRQVSPNTEVTRLLNKHLYDSKEDNTCTSS